MAAVDEVLALPESKAEAEIMAEEEAVVPPVGRTEAAPEGQYLPAEERAALELERVAGEVPPGKPHTLADFIAQGAEPFEAGITPEFQGYYPQVSPGISHPLAALGMGEVPGDFWYNKAAAPGSSIMNAEQYQAVVRGAAKVARGYTVLDYDTEAYFAANEAPMSFAAERAEKTYGAFNVSMRASMFGSQDTSIGVRTPAPLLDRPWEAQGYDWQPGSARSYWDNSSPEQQRQITKQITDNGLLDSYLDGNPYATGVGTSPFSDNPQLIIGVLDQALGVSRGEQISPTQAIGKLGGYVGQVRAWQSAQINAAKAATAALAPTKQPFSVPLSLRHIPDKREIAQDAKATFEAKLGRKALPGELEEISNELTGFHRRKQSEMIDLAYAWYEGSDSPDDFDLTETISDPSKVLAEEVETKWANEINLNERQERNGDSFGRMMRATGGNLGSQGSTRAAGGDNVVRI
jgi:hypothetical protein